MVTLRLVKVLYFDFLKKTTLLGIETPAFVFKPLFWGARMTSVVSGSVHGAGCLPTHTRGSVFFGAYVVLSSGLHVQCFGQGFWVRTPKFEAAKRSLAETTAEAVVCA